MACFHQPNHINDNKNQSFSEADDRIEEKNQNHIELNNQEEV